ncbi:hypothetical protein NH16_09225 [Leuconostoc mesenteroides subsp. dextranicum]|nr:hypothetical protein NH16_00075 [Leuconostoc mesenteroides subsp. dextranicum]AKP37071.1 hypothetical protein NH16_09225 [Leuconostoc mesenteroides subsp. dextranicum]
MSVSPTASSATTVEPSSVLGADDVAESLSAGALLLVDSWALFSEVLGILSPDGADGALSGLFAGASPPGKLPLPGKVPGADVKIMDRFFRHRELPDSESFSKSGFQLKTA